MNFSFDLNIDAGIESVDAFNAIVAFENLLSEKAKALDGYVIEFDEKELLSMEKEMLGIYISGHPLSKIREQIIKATNIDTMKMLEIKEAQSYKLR